MKRKRGKRKTPKIEKWARAGIMGKETRFTSLSPGSVRSISSPFLSVIRIKEASAKEKVVEWCELQFASDCSWLIA